MHVVDDIVQAFIFECLRMAQDVHDVVNRSSVIFTSGPLYMGWLQRDGNLVICDETSQVLLEMRQVIISWLFLKQLFSL
jgi:hypothetical protein